MDNINETRNFLKKCNEYNLTLHQLLIDVAQAYDSVKGKAALDLKKEYRTAKKLQDLATMTLREMKSASTR
jgi:hypothetical protein